MMFEDMHKKHMAGVKGEMKNMMSKIGKAIKVIKKKGRMRKGGKGESDGGEM